MDEWILDAIRSAGYVGLALLMALENILPFIPSELILPFAGFLVAERTLTMTGVIVWGSVGSTAGATAWYVLARAWGKARLHRFIDRYGRWVLLDIEDVEHAEAWFRQRQRRATFVGRLVPGVRSLISVPAGIARMPVLPFLAFTAAGATLWTTVLTVAGFLLADAYHAVGDVVGPVGTVVFALFIATLVIRRVRRARHARTA
jgi:membrane protein DedA with SNARE-associated domain